MDTIRKKCASPSCDEVIAALAARQHGVVARRQLRAAGVSDRGIAHRVAAKRLHRLHHGVYAVGHTVLGARGRWMAAVLACGPDAMLSHTAAGALWELRASAAAIVDVTLPGTGGRRRRPGVRIHRARSIETTVHEGIAVTTPARTVLDLAAILDRRPLERLLDHAEVTRLVDVPSLEALVAVHPGHRGARRLAAALNDHVPGTTLTRSELEERFLALVRRAGLPRPRVNVRVAGLEVDFLFPDIRLIVETDGWRYHRTRAAFESDRRRDAALAAAGYRTLRFTHRQVTVEATAVVNAVQAAYRGARAPSSLA